MATINTNEIYTVNEAAELFGKTTGRIRQICRDLELGTLVENRVRLLKKSDLNKIENYLGESGKNFSKES